MAEATLLRTPHYSMARDAFGLVWLRRSREPFQDVAQVRAQNLQVIEHLPRDAGGTAIVVDMRQAVPNNDPAFEAAMRHLRFTIGKRFAHVILLVATASGQMQVTRLHRNDSQPYGVARSEEEARRECLRALSRLRPAPPDSTGPRPRSAE